MTPEEHSLLERTLKTVEDNNKMLHSMRRSARISNIMHFLYWVVIIGLSIGAYYFIQPYLEMLMKFVGANSDTIQSATSSLQNLLKH